MEKQISLETVMEKANNLYANTKSEKLHINISYMAPELLPQIESDQVKCMVCHTMSM